MSELFRGICGKVAPGLCRLSIDGGIAIRTAAGYRTYDPASGRLTNCDNFVPDLGEDFFYVLPAARVKPGDIILAGGKPRCVVRTEDNLITVINYEDMTMEQLLPEHHIFMGGTCMFGRIVSLFGPSGAEGPKGRKKMMKYMILSSVLRGKENGNSSLLPLLMMSGKEGFFDEIFDGIVGEDGKEN